MIIASIVPLLVLTNNTYRTGSSQEDMMYKETARLIMYGNIDNVSILSSLANIFKRIEDGSFQREEVEREIYDQIYCLLQLATKYGFEKNLWHCYISYLLAINENPFSILCETVGATEGTANQIVKRDMHIFYELLNYDFTKIEDLLGIDCFRMITHYQSMIKDENTYNRSVSEKVNELAIKLAQATNGDDIFATVVNFYKQYGVGNFGLNKAFRIIHDENLVKLSPITHTSDVTLDELFGYEVQKKQLIDNTEAFVLGKKANNCLLFGDSGTGKSTCIKAICNKYYSSGLRLIEIYKHQFKDLSSVIEQIKNRNYRFIIYMDDLSFEEFEIEYKYLKAVIEGGLEVKPDNVLIYATSNRRHLIRETWGDRSDMTHDEGLHRSDTIQEKLSLVGRFGVTIHFAKPTKREYEEIVLGLARANEKINIKDKELLDKANAWSVRNGGYSGRVAEQFIIYLEGKE